MIDKKRIALMTKLAIYDKNFAEKDKEILEYFRHDYVYKQNSWARLFVFFGAFVIVLVDFGSKLFLNSMDVFSLNFENEVRGIILFVLFLLGLYTFICTIKYGADYSACERRFSRYQSLVEKLNRLEDTNYKKEEDSK